MRPLYSALALLVLLVAIGCGGSSPLSPSGPEKLDSQTTVSTSYNSHVLWGLWNVSIDPKTMIAEVLPLRGAQFTANVTQFMQPPSSPVNMIGIEIGPRSDPASGYFEVRVTLRHPFPGLNQYGGFDVRGILMADGSLSANHDTSVVRAGPGETQLLNPDGYSRWWNYGEFLSTNTVFGFTPGKLAPPNQPSATLNPYKYFADGLDETSPVTSMDMASRGFFATSPGANSREYDIQFKMEGDHPVLDFQYAVDASWEQPDPSFAPDYPKEAFPAAANCQEAFAISINNEGSTAFWKSPTENGGELKLSVEIYDWQSKANPQGVPGEVSGIWVESPLFAAPINILPSATVLPGTSDVSAIFQLTIGSLNVTHVGQEDVFITVESKSPATYEPQVPGGELFYYPSSPLAAFYVGTVSIAGEATVVTPTVLSIDPNWGYKDKKLTGVTITGDDFDPGATTELEYAPGDTIPGTNVQWINVTTIKADFDLTGATIGLYDVKVKNPFVPAGVLADGFEVKLFQAIWPVTQGNPRHTGTIGFNGPTGPAGGTFSPVWNYTFAQVGLGNATPCFLNDTTVFFAIPFNYLDTNHLPLNAINMGDRTLKWSKVFNTLTHSAVVPLALNADGSIVLAWDWPSSDIYGLDAEDGDTLWGPISGASSSSDAYATLDKNGNFIMPSSGGFKSINPQTGVVNWTTSIGSPSYCTPAVGPDGTIYGHVGYSPASLHAIDPATGGDKWSSFPSVGTCTQGVVVHPNGNIIVHGSAGLFCFHDDGASASLVWQQSYSAGWYCSPSVAPDGNIYLVDNGGVLRCINPDTGATIQSAAGYGTGYGDRPAIGDNGLIYLNSEGNFSCANPDCTLAWSFYGSFDSYWCAPAIGQDGTVYSARRNNGLCAWHD